MTEFSQELKQRRNKNLKISENFYDVEVIPTTSNASTSNKMQKLAIFEADWCKRLQKLSCIALSPEEEKKFGTQLTDIIGFLGQLPETGMKNEKGKMNNDGKLTLRTIAGVQEDKNGEKLMKNVKHEVVNNSIVIKSVLS